MSANSEELTSPAKRARTHNEFEENSEKLNNNDLNHTVGNFGFVYSSFSKICRFIFFHLSFCLCCRITKWSRRTRRMILILMKVFILDNCKSVYQISHLVCDRTLLPLRL